MNWLCYLILALLASPVWADEQPVNENPKAKILYCYRSALMEVSLLKIKLQPYQIWATRDGREIQCNAVIPLKVINRFEWPDGEITGPVVEFVRNVK